MMRDRGSSCSHCCRTLPRPERLTEPASESDTKRRRVRRHSGSSKACFSRWVHFGYVDKTLVYVLQLSSRLSRHWFVFSGPAREIISTCIVVVARCWHGDATVFNDSVFVSGAACPRLRACCPQLSNVYSSGICADWLSVNIFVHRATKPFFSLSFTSQIIIDKILDSRTNKTARERTNGCPYGSDDNI